MGKAGEPEEIWMLVGSSTPSVRGEGRGEEKEFLYVKYDGRDAVQVRLPLLPMMP
jgi:hypothetical protein